MERSRVELGLPVLEVLTSIPDGLFGIEFAPELGRRA